MKKEVELLTKKRIFMRFLDANKARRLFLNEFNKRNITYGIFGIHSFFKRTDHKPEDFVTNAFMWNESENGLKYWIDMHHKWEEICSLIFKYK